MRIDRNRLIPTGLAAALLLASAGGLHAADQRPAAPQPPQPPSYYPQPPANPWYPQPPAPARPTEPAKPKAEVKPAVPAAAPAPAAAPVAAPPKPPAAATPPAATGTRPNLPADITLAESRLGQVLADTQGRTLYILDQELSGIPVCTGQCAKLWPPYLAGPQARILPPFYPVSRDDGGRQWTWNGRPLYRWFGDTAPGDVTGDGIDGVWHAARP